MGEMRKENHRLIGGGLLILAGILFLLQEFGFLGNAVDFIWMGLIGAGAVVFLWIYFTKGDQWWAIIPGLTLLGLTLIFVEDYFDILPGYDWGGSIFLGCIGLAFWLIYLKNPIQWWAIIPGGVLITLALVAGLDNVVEWTGAVFFLGLAATFALIAVLPNQSGDTRWAFIPAGILAILGIVLIAPFLEFILDIWPILLIGAGIYILFRGTRNKVE
jgi:hypothetical protein